MEDGSAFDWQAFEEELVGELVQTLAEVGRQHADRKVHAVALHGLARELDGLLSLPILGVGCDDEHAEEPAGGFSSPRWSPGDWELGELHVRDDAGLRLEQALTGEANRDTPAHWRAVEAAYLEFLVRVAQSLRVQAPVLLATTEDFVAFVSDEELGHDLAARTIPSALVARFFAPQIAAARERERVRALDVKERAAFLVTRLGRFDGLTTEVAQRELLEIGEPALDALLSMVAHPKEGWAAAMLIGKIGASRADVVEALRKRAGKSHWHATALGLLGDHAWLARQPDAVSVHGFTASLKAIAEGRPRPLDYRPLEQYLAGAPATTCVLVEKALAPGSAYVEARANDVPEALRGLGSRHAVVRWHAAALLGDRSWGPDVGASVLPALVARFSDEHAIVRRLAVLSLSAWKAAARPFRQAIAALGDDPDETVRAVVAHALAKVNDRV